MRLVRLMRPDVIVTIDPALTVGQHGNHQVAGRLADGGVPEAAADPTRFPELLHQESLPVWKVRKLYYASGSGASLTVPTDKVSPSRGKSYGAIAGEALRDHRSQGFDKFFGPRPARSIAARAVRASEEPRAAAAQEERDLLDGVDSLAAAAADLTARPERFQVAADQPFIVRAV